MIQPFEANSAVQMTSMSMTSYRSLFAWRFATSWASWPLDASGSRSRVTFWPGWRWFQPVITPCSQPGLSLPMANVIGPIPSVDGAGPPDEALHPAVSRNPAARTAIPGIARLMQASTKVPRDHVKFVHACYALPLCICQQHHITSPTCFAAPPRSAAHVAGRRSHLRGYPQRWLLSVMLGLTSEECTAIF